MSPGRSSRPPKRPDCLISSSLLVAKQGEESLLQHHQTGGRLGASRLGVRGAGVAAPRQDRDGPVKAQWQRLEMCVQVSHPLARRSLIGRCASNGSQPDRRLCGTYTLPVRSGCTTSFQASGRSQISYSPKRRCRGDTFGQKGQGSPACTVHARRPHRSTTLPSPPGRRESMISSGSSRECFPRLKGSSSNQGSILASYDRFQDAGEKG